MSSYQEFVQFVSQNALYILAAIITAMLMLTVYVKEQFRIRDERIKQLTCSLPNVCEVKKREFKLMLRRWQAPYQQVYGVGWIPEEMHKFLTVHGFDVPFIEWATNQLRCMEWVDIDEQQKT